MFQKNSKIVSQLLRLHPLVYDNPMFSVKTVEAQSA